MKADEFAAMSFGWVSCNQWYVWMKSDPQIFWNMAWFTVMAIIIVVSIALWIVLWIWSYLISPHLYMQASKKIFIACSSLAIPSCINFFNMTWFTAMVIILVFMSTWPRPKTDELAAMIYGWVSCNPWYVWMRSDPQIFWNMAWFTMMAIIIVVGILLWLVL